MRTVPFRTGMVDFSRGVLGGTTDPRLGGKPFINYVTRVDNVLFRPLRAASVRAGSRNITSGAAPASTRRYHSALRYYGSSPSAFLAARDSGTPYLYKVDATTYTAQTIPAGFSLLGVLHSCMCNDVLVAAEDGAPAQPMFYAPSNPANTWLTCVLPPPAATPLTLTAAAGGSKTALGSFYYRVRYIYANGLSTASTPQAIGPLGAGNQTVDVTNIPAGSRADFLYWRLEVTKSGSASTGSYYIIAEGTSSTTSFSDTLSDGSLLDRVDEAVTQPIGTASGAVSYKGRLVCWKDSSLFVSQLPGDLQGSGIFNQHPALEYRFPTRDGDGIKCCFPQGDRLIVVKGGSVHALEGVSPESFRIVDIYDGAGAAGPRAAWCVGSDVFIMTAERGLVRVRGNSVDNRFGWVEVGHYLDEMASAAMSRVVVRSWRNQLLLVCYPGASATTNTDMLVYDLRYNIWSHFTNWRARDFVEVTDGYLSATAMFTDEAQATCWSGFVGTRDACASDGSGGSAIPFALETPYLDEGDVSMRKDYERGEVIVRTGQGNLSLAFSLETGQQFSVPLSVLVGSARWATATASPLRWAPGSNASYVYRWAGQRDRTFEFGVPLGTTGKKMRVRVSGSLTQSLSLQGFVIDGRMLPERPYSRRT